MPTIYFNICVEGELNHIKSFVQSRLPFSRYLTVLSPWEESSEAFTLGVHMILLYFIRISLLTPKIFVLFWWWVAGILFLK